MTLADLTWPEASVDMALIAAIGLVVAVLVWSTSGPGRPRSERTVERRSKLRGEVDTLRAQLEG